WRLLRPAVEVAVAALLLHALKSGVPAGAAAARGAAAAAGNVLDQAVEETRILFCQRLALVGGGLGHRRLYRESLGRLAFQCTGDDTVPQASRQRPSGDLPHLGTVVIAHPDADDQLGGEADEPGVT